jgi:16S rRNA (cytosine967-C5)-methyltransferase
LSLRCNTLKLPPDRLRQELEREGVESLPSPLVPEGLRAAHLSRINELYAFREGYFTVQDDSSMLTSIALQPAPGSVMVDACSGPGGKATHLAQLMRNQGRIIAFDIHEHRLQLIRDAACRLGVQIIETRLGDAGRLPDEMRGQADALLVDAPCSGLGVIRRRPELRWRVQAADLPRHHDEQLRILTGAAACLKQGGLLLYSTCSSEPEENIDVVSEFREQQPEFKAEDLSDRIPFPLAEQEERDSARNGLLQLLPHRQGIDGFFIALMRKC